MAGFVKLDAGILDSTVWPDLPVRNVFLTALVMADPHELTEATPQIAIDSVEPTGWVVPPGWYGLVRAAGPGIVRRACIEQEAGLEALRILGAPDPHSRSTDFEGRRLVRTNGGFVVLNFFRYRDRDYTAADRMRRLRARRKADVTANDRNVRANVTHSRGQRAEAEAETTSSSSSSLEDAVFQELTAEGQGAFETLRPCIGNLSAFLAELHALVDGRRDITPRPTWAAVSLALADLVTNDAEPDLLLFRAYVRKAGEQLTGNGGPGRASAPRARRRPTASTDKDSSA